MQGQLHLSAEKQVFPLLFHYHGSSGSVSACSWVVTSLPSWPLVTFSVSFSRRSSDCQMLSLPLCSKSLFFFKFQKTQMFLTILY